jgi:hypothetical protein
LKEFGDIMVNVNRTVVKGLDIATACLALGLSFPKCSIPETIFCAQNIYVVVGTQTNSDIFHALESAVSDHGAEFAAWPSFELS